MTEKKNTVSIVTELSLPVCEKHGVELWDVRFEKEGSQWYLRVLIDRDEPVMDIDTCEKVSREISDLLDRADPIPQSYILEVGSPGLDRELTRPDHFKKYLGSRVRARLIRPMQDGLRDVTGILISYEGESVVIADDDGKNILLNISETAYIKAYDEIEFE